MKEPLISIIISTFNRAHLISETLHSVSAQTYENWECIIVDDGSTDNTKEVLKKYVIEDSRFHYYKRPLNKIKGPNSCRNFGFKLSKGEYIHWFDSDDLYFPDALEAYIKCFDKDIDVVIAKIEKINPVTKDKYGENNIFSTNIINNYLTGEITFYVCGPLWKRSFLNKQVYLFDEMITNLDDWDFNLRMLYENPKIFYIDRPYIKYRMHQGSLSKEIDKLNFHEIKSEFNAREKHVKLLKINQKADVNILKRHIKNRYKYILRATLLEHNPQRNYFLKMVLYKQLNMFDFKGVFKTIFSFILFRFFRKGYKFLN
jgi:glycosyltransferase involved in cell wall biosynthesis